MNFEQNMQHSIAPISETYSEFVLLSKKHDNIAMEK